LLEVVLLPEEVGMELAEMVLVQLTAMEVVAGLGPVRMHRHREHYQQ
jgi:hypothetical protein